MQDDFAKSLPADFVHSLIEMANQNNDEMTGSMDEVRIWNRALTQARAGAPGATNVAC